MIAECHSQIRLGTQDYGSIILRGCVFCIAELGNAVFLKGMILRCAIFALHDLGPHK